MVTTRRPSTGPTLARTLLAAVVAASGLAASSRAQDSVAAGAAGNDALSPYEPAHQRRAYVVDLVPAPTSWGRRVAIGPVMKASRATEPAGGVTPPTNILGATAVSPGVLGPVTFPSRGYSAWTVPGQGAHPTLNAAPGATLNITGYDRQFCIGLTDFARLSTGSVPTNISGAIVGQSQSNLRRLYVERTYAIVSRALSDSEDTATLTLGAADASGNVYVRGDDFLSLFPNIKVLGENIARVSLPARSTDPAPSNALAINFLLKELLGPANQGWDTASTTVLVNNSGSPLVCPTAAPQNLIPGQAPVFGNAISPDFSGVVRAGSIAGSISTLGGVLAPGAVSLRGNPSYSTTSASLNGLPPVASPGGTFAMLATTAGGSAEQRSLAPITSINIVGLQFTAPGSAPTPVAGAARLATLPPTITDSPDAPTTPATFTVGPGASYQFTHALGQTPFRGPSGQVGIGQLPGAAGDLLAAATARDNAQGEFIAVKRFVAGAGPTDHWVVAAHSGKPVLSGPLGNAIGTLIGGSPAGMSSPAIDLLGNVYFVSRWQPGAGQPNAGSTQTGLFKAVLAQIDTPATPSSSGLTYRLELLLTTGQSVVGANSATAYTITGLRLADSNSAASGGFHAGQIVQSQALAPGQTTPVTNPVKIFSFGGVVVNATIEYAGAQRYEAALFVGPWKTLAGDLNDDGVCDFLDLNLALSFFGQSGASSSPGDADNDGDCDFTDLNFVLSDFGTTEP